ncbi:MAG: DUF296 domain-containing protein [Thermoanaerobaculia bacterium]
MKEQVLKESAPRVHLLVFEIDDELNETLTQWARHNGIQGAHFKAIGALHQATIAYWNWETKKYEDHHLDEQVEVVSLIGNIAVTEDGETKMHAHVVVGRSDLSTLAGHLKSARIRPTLELVLEESESAIRRKHDDRTGLTLISVEGS